MQAYTVEQVAEMLAVGRDKVYYLLRTGQLRSIKIGKLRRITDQHLAEFIASLIKHHLLPLIGGIKLATNSLQRLHANLKRSIRQAQARDRVLRNVAELVSTPKGTGGRPSKAMTFDQATAMLEAARAFRLHAYFVVSLLTGIRTEEARALLWSHVVAWADEAGDWPPVTDVGFDHQRFAIYVWRSVRASGDTKTEKSRRTLELPGLAADALREHRTRQLQERLAAGPLWHDHGLVFASQTGEPLDGANVRRSFRSITTKAGLGTNWTPRELRHSFVIDHERQRRVHRDHRRSRRARQHGGH